MNRRLYRSPDDRVLAGVAGGMAETYDLDPAIVRVGWALLALLTGGIFLVIYIVMALVVPLRPAGMPVWAPSYAGPPANGMPSSTDVPPGPDAPLPPAGQPYYYGHRHRRRDGSGAIVFGLILIVLGGFFLARQFVPAINMSLVWPVVAIIGGGLLIVGAFMRSGRTQ